MMQFWRAAVIALLLAATPIAAQTFPEDVDLYVNDYANLLNETQESELRDVLEELFQARDIEFTVVTIEQLSDYGHTGSIESFATALFNTWGIGDAERNDGLLLLVSRFDRELRIEVGAGYGDTLDGPMQRIINKQIVPYFRLDDYPLGIRAGVDEIIFQVTDRYPGEYDASGLQHGWNTFKRFIVNLGWWLLAPFAAIVPFGFQLFRRYQRNRPRKCPNDGSPMRRYLEETEDDSLSEGQIVEEHLKSIDYDVWYCDRCDHVTVEAYRAWSSRYGACRDCGFRTVEGDSRTIRSATYSSSGLRKTDYTCHHCSARYTVESTIPKKTKNSSSSGGRSGGRGGGRSSGGGASGSW